MPKSARTWIAPLLALALGARAETRTLLHTATLYQDDKEAKLSAPEGVACTDEGAAVIADSGNGRLLLTRVHDGTFMGASEIKLPQLGHPVRVQIDSTGDVLSLDQRGRRIARVGLGGEFKGFVELPEGRDGRAPMPVAFKLDPADNLYLLDASSARVLVLDASGKLKRDLPLPGGEFVDVAVDARQTIYALDAVGGAVWAAGAEEKKFTPFASRLHDVASFPSYLAATGGGRLLVVDSHGNGLLFLGPDGSFLGRQLGIGWADGSLYYPAQACANANGVVIVADRNNNRVQAFQESR